MHLIQLLVAWLLNRIVGLPFQVFGVRILLSSQFTDYLDEWLDPWLTDLDAPPVMWESGARSSFLNDSTNHRSLPSVARSPFRIIRSICWNENLGFPLCMPIAHQGVRGMKASASCGDEAPSPHFLLKEMHLP